jgi:hypothetical protein
VNISYSPLLLLFSLSFQAISAFDSQEQAKLDLQRALFPEQYQSLDVSGQAQLVIIHENTNAIPRGIAILMGEAGHSVMSRDGLAPLAQKLNGLGWVTMAVQTPDIGLSKPQEPQGEDPPPEPQDPAITAVFANSAPVSIDPENFLEHEQQVIAQMTAISEKSADYPGFSLVIAQGTTAAWLAKIYAEKKLDTPDAFVAISPYWPSREHNSQLADYLAATEMPVLDLHSAWDNEWGLQGYPARQIAATKALKLQYRQREIIGLALHNQQAEYLSKEIYGWLSYMGW